MVRRFPPTSISETDPRAMLALFRRFLGTWPARVFFVVLVGSFGLWGISGVLGNLGGDDGTTVARVGGTKISVSELQDAARRLLAQFLQSQGGRAAPTPEIRRSIADQAMQQLIIQAAFANEAARLHVTVPDDALRQATFDTRGFQGPNGQFNRATFEAVLRNNGLTEQRYLELMRTDLAQRQVVEAVRAGGYSSKTLDQLVYSFGAEKRVADLVVLPFATAAAPPAPTDEQLQRQYDDNLHDYTAPAMRRIKAVILTPETLAKDIHPTDAQLHAYYDAHRADYNRPASRSVQVIGAPTEAIGRSLATAWIAGADWTVMQAQAATAGASAVELDDSTQPAFPDPELGEKVFAATPDAVTGPVKTDLGYQVFKVTAATPATVQAFEQVQADVAAHAALELASDQVYDKANKLQDALAGGAKLDELPTDLGVAAVTGTLDAAGNTPAGTPAPLPGSDALRTALIAHAFSENLNDPPTLENGPDGTFYAVTVEDITPPTQKPFADVADRVRDDWERAARRHEQDAIATKLLIAVNGGTPIADAAKDAGVTVARTAELGRGAPPPGVPAQLIQPLFVTPQGKATMVEDPTGFAVAVTVDVRKADPAADPQALDRLRLQLSGAMSNDLEITYANALRLGETVTVNTRLLDSIAQ